MGLRAAENVLVHHFDSLRARLLASLAVLFLVLVGMALAMRAAVLDAAREEAAARAMRVAERFAAIQQQQVEQTRSLLETLARLLPAGATDCRRTLRSLLDQQAHLANLMVVDGDASLHCIALAPAVVPPVFLDRPALRHAADSGGFFLGSFFRSPLGKPVRHAVLMVSGATGDSRYLVAAIDLEQMNALIAAQMPPGFVVRMTDREGVNVVRQPDPQCCLGRPEQGLPGLPRAIAAGGPQVIEKVRWSDGVDRLQVDFPMREPIGGVLSVGVPADAVEAPANRMLPIAVTAMLAVVVLATALVWWGAEAWILRPMRRLADAAHQMRLGRPGAPANLSQGTVEWRALAEDFNGMAAALADRQGELEARVSERTRELENANRELKSTNRELEAFAYSVSHDLRAPLRAIDGFSHLLQDDCAAHTSEQAREYLGRVRAAAQRMGELIDDLLMLSRISRQEMQRCTVDLAAVAQDVAQELAQGEPDRRVAWRIVGDLRVEADPTLMRVALVNLLGNAWKYTSRQPLAQIEFGVRDDNGRRIFHVRDNGAGFDMAYAAKLFGAFQRLHSAADFPGTGVGLATVARVIHRHGGEVWAEAQPDQGATFFFTLPTA